MRIIDKTERQCILFCLATLEWFKSFCMNKSMIIECNATQRMTGKMDAALIALNICNALNWKTLISYVKVIVHFKINFWYFLAYLKGIQDVGVFVFRSSFNFDSFRSNRSCLSVI